MSRYIEANAYRKKWADIFDSAYGDSCCEMFKNSIDEQPTADVVPSRYGCGSVPYCSDVWEVDEDE